MCKEGQVQSMAQVCSNRSNLLKRERERIASQICRNFLISAGGNVQKAKPPRAAMNHGESGSPLQFADYHPPGMLRNSWHILIQVIISSCIVFSLVLSISWRVARYSHRSRPYRTPRVGDMQRKEGDVERKGKSPELCHS